MSEIKLIPDLSSEDLAAVNEIEMRFKRREANLNYGTFMLIWDWADFLIKMLIVFLKLEQNNSSDSVAGFNTAMFDRVYSGSMGFTAIRSIGEASSIMFNLSGTGSRQDVETTDNYESLGLTFGFDTSIGNHILSPYLMVNKIDYETDAINKSFMVGFGNYYAINDAHSLNYGYSYSDSKNNQTSSYSTADETNVISQSITAGYDFTLNETISTSVGLGYGDSDAKA